MRGQLTKTDKALTKAKNWADRWRKEAKAQKRSASRAKARVAKLNQQLDAASDGRNAFGSTGDRAHDRGVTEANETWRVVQLRAEAHARGLTGMSNTTKAQLLAGLS